MPTALPPAHQRLIIGGVLQQAAAGGSEIFEFSMAIVSGMSAAAAAAAAKTVVNAFWGHDVNQGIPTTAVVHYVRVEDVLADGKVGDSYQVNTDQDHGLASNEISTILSHCITLETSTPGAHGRSVRGRFYPPASCSVVGSTAVLSDVETYANQWIGLINGLNSAGLIVSVASRTAGGQIATVVGITVDTIVDTVRRRKNHVTGNRTPLVAVSS